VVVQDLIMVHRRLGLVPEQVDLVVVLVDT
jgi:hypothetical protein